MLYILGKLIATFYALAPFVAAITAFFNPMLGLGIFICWIVSAGTIVGLCIITLVLKSIWDPSE